MAKIITALHSHINRLFSKISKNVFWLISLNIVTAICQFIVYALINRNLGKEILGVWSLVIAATSIGQISSFGFSNGLVRYLPELIQKNDSKSISKLVATVNFSNFFLSLPVLFLLYIPAIKYAAYLLNDYQFNLFRSVIIWCMAGLFINNLFSVYTFLLDGMQKYYIRCMIQITGWLLFLILSIVLIPLLGIKGVAIAFFIQSIWQFAIAIFVVAKIKGLKIGFPLGFDKKSFMLVSAFGVKLQFISVLTIFFDPLVKFFITKNMGLSATANYELSNKIVMQARNLLVNSNQVIVPQIVIHKTLGDENIYFKNVIRKNIFFAVAVGMLLLLGSPVAILLFSKHFDSDLMSCIVILNCGWVCNMITSVHYYSCIGLDKLNSLVIYHLILALTVALLYITITNFFHWKFLYFIVPALALFLGSLYNSFALSKIVTTSFTWLSSGNFLYFIFATFTLLIVSYSSIANFYILYSFLLIVYLFLTWRKYKSRDYLKKLNANE